jgi:hypothetical protein
MKNALIVSFGAPGPVSPQWIDGDAAIFCIFWDLRMF